MQDKNHNYLLHFSFPWCSKTHIYIKYLILHKMLVYNKCLILECTVYIVYAFFLSKLIKNKLKAIDLNGNEFRRNNIKSYKNKFSRFRFDSVIKLFVFLKIS